jgi:2-polyprenyl-6-methoxyphenol hydroxylase-like FAD-dependent oxidoreductase
MTETMGARRNFDGASRSHALVIGGSVAGLVTARVLSRHFARVTLVDRDRFPMGPCFRAGVPQSRHLHVLLAKGRALLERLFPGLTMRMVAAGAPLLTFTRDALWQTPVGWSERFNTGEKPLLSSSRELLEFTIRQQLLNDGRVRVIEGADVIGLTATSDRSTVTGVRVQPRSRNAGGRPAMEEIGADLVVDASGRASRAPRWLEALGYDAPRESTVNSFVGYASRLYRIPPPLSVDWRILFLQPDPPLTARGGTLFPIEGDRWIVTLVGAGRDYPPTDEAGFLEFARSLRSPLLYEAIRDAEPLNPISGYRTTENRRRHYERMPQRPQRFLVTGDAVCAFNPIYGQGMTVAASDALILHRSLMRVDPYLTGLVAQFQSEVARANADVWLIATGEDLRYPTTEGAKPDLLTRLTNRYLDRVTRVATRHPGVCRALSEVMNLEASPFSLFSPTALVPALFSRAAPLVQPPTTTGVSSATRATTDVTG